MSENFYDGIIGREIEIDKDFDEVTAKKIKEIFEREIKSSGEGQDPVKNFLKNEELFKKLAREQMEYSKKIAKPIDEIDEDE